MGAHTTCCEKVAGPPRVPIALLQEFACTGSRCLLHTQVPGDHSVAARYLHFAFACMYVCIMYGIIMYLLTKNVSFSGHFHTKSGISR